MNINSPLSNFSINVCKLLPDMNKWFIIDMDPKQVVLDFKIKIFPSWLMISRVLRRRIISVQNNEIFCGIIPYMLLGGHQKTYPPPLLFIFDKYYKQGEGAVFFLLMMPILGKVKGKGPAGLGPPVGDIYFFKNKEKV